MSSIKVAVRVRPLNEKEKDQGSREIIDVSDKTITIENVKINGIPEIGDSRVKYKAFSYDHCYDCIDPENAYATQEQVFSDLGTQVLNSALDGFNACVFAYGQTGTGKTHTMMGYQGDPGLIPRICEGLFESIDKCPADNVSFRVDISYFEIYNEKVRDLLQAELFNKQKDSQWLKVREHPKDGPYVQDLSWHRVREYTEIQAMLERGNENRVTAETHIHGHSSRSHAIVTVCFTQARLEENRPSEIVSKINLVDLAGSEKAGPSNIPDFRTRLKEGSNINRSLVTLGYIIKMLAEQSLLTWSTEDMGSTQSFSGSGGGESPAGSSPAGPNKQRIPFIPYRDSVLTRLLKDSLGGNSKTIMIATITPASQFYSETLSTLRYAQRAKNIINKPRVNEDSNVALIRELRREIERLRNMLASAQKGGDMISLQEAEDTILAEKLLENEEMAKQLTQSWMGKWSSTHDVMKDSDLSIRNLRHRSSSMGGVMIDSQLPYLFAMEDDILSTGIFIFHLKEGETTVGREDAEVSQDIALMGPNIQPEHCVIRHENGVVMIHPLPGAECTVQGQECTEPTRLSQGDYVVFGGDQVFRFNNPVEAAKLRESRKSMGSLNTLNTSYPSFGGLSRASSYSSIGADDSNFLSPYSQLGRSYPNYAASDLCHELERKHQCEQERMAEVRNKLDQLQEEHEKAEEIRLEKEEEMYALHEQHRQEVAEQKQQLQRLIEENERARQKAEEELLQARESLAAEKEAFQKQLDAQRKELKDLHKTESSQESAGIQTEPLATKSSSTDAINVTGVSIGTDSTDDIAKDPLPVKKQRKMSVEDQLKELEHNEFSRRMSYRETEESLSIQQEDIEDQYYQTQEKIREKMAKIEQIETQYKEMDKECLKEMSEQTEKVDELRKQEAQLEVYLQENEELRNVTQDVPRPLRSACSEISLQVTGEEYPHKTASLIDVHRQPDTLNAPEINIYSASAESLQSEQFNMETEQSQGEGQSKRISVKDRVKREKEKKKEKDITSVARDVTSRLYKPPEPKFKYVPKVKEKEVTPAPRPPRVRDTDTRSRNSPSRFTPTHSPSPQRSVHSPSPLRQSGKRTSPSPQRDILPKNSSHPNKSTQKKGGPNSKFNDKKPGGKDSKVMAVRNKSENNNTSPTHRALSPGSTRGDSESPDRLSPVGGRLPSTKLRQMASASSLASVPESVSEESEVSQEDTKPAPVSYVVKRRAKKGRSGLFDDEFRTHSAPDSQNLEKAFNDYMISPRRQESERVLPVYTASVSVDDTNINGDYDTENKGDNGANDMDYSDNGTNGALNQPAEREDMDTSINGHGAVVLGKRDNESLIDNTEPALISPRKRSKSEGADDIDFGNEIENENKTRDNTERRENRDEHFSDDSLNNSNVSEDSLEGKGFEPERLSKSLPAYLIKDDKPISDDSLNDSLEDKKDLSDKDVACDNDNASEKCDQIENVDMNIPSATNAIPEKTKTNLSRVILSSIDITGTDILPSIDKESVDTGTLTDSHESQELSQENKNSNNTKSAHSKDQEFDRLKIINLPNVSIESSEKCDKGIQNENNLEMNNTDKDKKASDEDPSETCVLEERLDNNKQDLTHAEDSAADISQEEEACDAETLDKVKQYIENIVDDAKVKVTEQTNHNLDSAIELSPDEHTVEMSSLSENEFQSYDDVDGFMHVADQNLATQENEAVQDSMENQRNMVDNDISKQNEDNLKGQKPKITNEADANTSLENASVPVENKLHTDRPSSCENCENEKFENDKNLSDKSEGVNTETIATECSKSGDDTAEVMETDSPTEVTITENEKDKDSCTDKGGNSSEDNIPVLCKSIGVGTSFECLDQDLENNKVNTDDSCPDPDREIQFLQDALEQLPARPQSSGPQLSTARRAARQRAMIRQQQRAAGDVDSAEPGSDDSPASGNRSKASSRPGSGSRRRKRPQSKLNDKSKPALGHSSDDYDSSENDSVYSNGSIEDVIQQQANGECENGVLNDSFNSGLTDSSELCDAEEMSRRLKNKLGRHPNKRKLGSTEVEEGPDGKRTVGIQTYGPPNNNSRPDFSDFDSSSEMGRNMAVSPLCLWTSDRSEEGKRSSRNSSSSTGVGKAGSEPEKGMRPSSRSSIRSVSSVFLENSNLGKGVTDVWSTSASDIRPLPDFNDDLSYVLETEAMTPGATCLDITENAPSGVSFIQPSGERDMVRPGCSTPKNPGRIVSIMYPESQTEQAENIDYSKPVTFEVTVHEDNTNITYNVEKTEYKTYALKNEDQTKPSTIPDTIHVNITENQSTKTEEKFVSETKEEVKLCLPNLDGDDRETGTIDSDRSVRSSYSSEKETNIQNGELKSENVKELKQSLDNPEQFKVSSSKKGPVKKKKATLQTSGLVETSDYPSRLSDEDMHQCSPKDGLDMNLDESDITSDYGTFISFDERKCSDSEDESKLAGNSPHASIVSRQIDNKDNSVPVLNLAGGSIECVENTGQLETCPVPPQSETLCSNEDVETPIHIAGRTQQSSPVQFMFSPTLESSLKERESEKLNSSKESNHSSTPHELEETDSGSYSTVKPLNENELSVNSSLDNKQISDNEKHDKSFSSVDEAYLSPEADNNNSSCSSEYRTPQQSPRTNVYSDPPVQVTNVMIPDMLDSASTASTPRVENTEEDSNGPMLTSSPKVTRTVSVNTDVAQLPISPETAKVKHGFKNPCDPIHTEALRREIESRMANLQRNARSLSDSAISSDYTDCDSSSPRGNRNYDNDKKAKNKKCKNIIGPSRINTVTHRDPCRALNFESEAVKHSSFKDSGSVLDDDTDSTDKEEEYMKLPQNNILPVNRIKIKEQFMSPFHTVGRFPETIVGAVLALKPYPVQRSASLDSISTLVKTGTNLSKADRHSQSFEDVQGGNDVLAKHEEKSRLSNQRVHKANKIDNAEHAERPLSPGEIGIGQGSIDDMVAAVENENITPDMDMPLNNIKTNLVPEKATSMSFLDDNKTGPDYHRSLSEGNIGQMEDIHDTSCTSNSNDSITFVFVGREYNQEDESNDCNQCEDSEDNSAEGSPNDPYNKINISGRGPLHSSCSDAEDGSAVLSRSASEESNHIIENTEHDMSTHSASEEINEIIQCTNYSQNMQTPMESSSSPPTVTDFSENVFDSKYSMDEEDSAPLRHRYGIDESVLPIPERSMSADNIPKQVLHLKDLNRSRSTSMLDMAAAEKEESESGIFPPALSYVDEDNTDPSMSLRTMSEGALEQMSQRSISDRGVTFSDQTSSELQSSEMESSSSANMRSVCSNASSAEEIIEEYTINYTSNHPRYRTSIKSDGDDIDFEDAHILEEEEHVREVLRTVEKFLLPRPQLVDRETSTDPIDITVSEISDDKSPKTEISTQTAVNAATMIQPDQIILPALSAQYRSMSVDSFGLGRHGQDISLSEGAQNWCTLGELMIETTQLLRTINDRLPDMDKSGSISSEDSQAILKQWQEISVQTGNSLQDLNSIGLQTGEHQENQKPQSISCGTQVDSDLRMKHLQPSETSTCEVMLLGVPEGAANDISFQTDTESETEGAEEQTEECIEPSTASSNYSEKQTKNSKFNQSNLKEATIKQKENDMLKPTSNTNTHIESYNESSTPSSPRQTLTLPNTPEMEDLRKEHNKLMENLKKASEQRKARKDTIKARKQKITELTLTNTTTNDSESSQNQGNKSSNGNIANEGVDIPDTRSSVSSSLASPHEIVQINIKTDPYEGITINNKMFKQRQRKELVCEEQNETETHSWKLLPSDAFKDMPDSTNGSSRNESTSSSTSVDTAVSLEVAKVMKNSKQPLAKETVERPGAINPMFMKDENSEEVCLNKQKPLLNSKQPKANKADGRAGSPQSDSTIESEVFADNYEPSERSPCVDENLERSRRPGAVPTFIKSETSPKLANDKRIVNPKQSKNTDLPNENLFPKLNENLKSDSEISADEDAIVPEKSTKKLVMPPLSTKKVNDLLKPKNYITDDSSETESVVEDIVEPIKNVRNNTLPTTLIKTDRPSLSPKRSQSDQSDYGTQVSVEFSDDCTQTDPELQNESPMKSHTEQMKEPKISEDINNKLERLQEQNSHIMEMLNMSSMPPSLTVEKLEAKLNHCIGQTDLLMNSYDEKDFEHTRRITKESTKALDILSKYREDLKKAKDDINECRERLNTGKEPGIGRGRTPYRRKDLQRFAQVEAFKLERFREQQDYERSRSNTPSKQNTPLRGNTPLIGNSPVVTPRSVDRSRSSSPTNVLGFLAPKEHKAHLIDLRKQLIADVVEEEKPSRSFSPALSASPSPQRPKHRGESTGFSPKTSPERRSPLASSQGRNLGSPKRAPFSRYREPEDVDKSRSPTMSMPIEEMLRRSSFSSTSSQRSGSSRNEPFISPRSHSDTRVPRKSDSPKQPDYSQPLRLNLDDLNDDDQPYSPYSAYARERVLPRERSPVGTGGVVRGTFELYSGSSQSDASSVRSFGSDLDLSQGPVNPLDEESVKHSRPVRAEDIKSRLGRHKR